MSDVIIGYDPGNGRLILGQHRDALGRWVEPLYTHDDMMICAATDLDKHVLGDAEYVIVVWCNNGAEGRYRVAVDLSFRGFLEGDEEREAQLLKEAADSRGGPPESEPFDALTLATKPHPL